MEVLVMGVAGIINILCFVIGAKIGQTVAKEKEIKIPSPAKVVTEYRERKEYKEEQRQIQTMLENIEIYDGTGMNQKEV